MMNKIIKEIKLKAEDIPCTACAEDMEIILRNQEGILEAKVDYGEEIIHIKYDPEVIERTEVIHSARRIGNISKIISEQ
jgi:copper chaperone CopZ